MKRDVLAVVLAAALLWALPARTFAQAPPPPPPPSAAAPPSANTPAVRQGSGPTMRTLEDYAIIGEVNIFRPWDDTPRVEPEPEPEAEPSPKPDETSVKDVDTYANYQLTGIVDYGEGLRAVIAKVGTREWEFYGVGDEIADGIHVVSIAENEAVVLEGRGERVRLVLHKKKPPAPSRPGRTPARSPRPQTRGK